MAFDIIAPDCTVRHQVTLVGIAQTLRARCHSILHLAGSFGEMHTILNATGRYLVVAGVAETEATFPARLIQRKVPMTRNGGWTLT